MDADELPCLLKERGVPFTEKTIQNGVGFKCKTAELLNVFDSGNMSFQGRRTPLRDEIQALYEGHAAGPATPITTASSPPVESKATPSPIFVVYGHDVASRDQLELLLRRMGLNPIILGSLPASGDTVIEKLERYLGEHGNVGFACVLLTPDDEGYKSGLAEEKKYRARQNVVLELGWCSRASDENALPFSIKNPSNSPAIFTDCSIYLSKSALKKLNRSC